MIRWFKSLWTKETDGLSAAAFIIGAASIASRAVGVVRDRVLASTFGAGGELDTYYAAFRLPDTLYTLLVFGALSAGFIPVFSEYLERKGREEALHLAEQMIAVGLIALMAGSFLLMIFAEELLPFLAPGFTETQAAQTVELSRILALSPILLGVSAILGGVLQSFRRFIAFSLAPVLYNVGIIFGAVFFVPWLGMRGVAWGVVLGAAMHLCVQCIVAWQLGLRRIPWPSLKSEGVRRILRMMVPRTLSLAVTQFNLFVVMVLASHLEPGAIAVFNFANNLYGVPVGLIGVSFAIAAFPAMSRAFGAQNEEMFGRILLGGARKMAFFLVPATALYVLLRAQIVRLVLGAGAFGWGDTIRTADVLGILAFGMLAQSLVMLYVRAFFARHDTWTPFWISIGAALANLGFAFWLVDDFGVVGLAAAFAAASVFEMLCHWVLMRMHRGGLPSLALLASAGKIFLATAALSIVGYAVRQLIGTWFPLRMYWQLLLQFTAVMVSGSAAYLLVSWALKSAEVQELTSAIRGRLWRGARLTESAEEASHST